MGIFPSECLPCRGIFYTRGVEGEFYGIFFYDWDILLEIGGGFFFYECVIKDFFFMAEKVTGVECFMYCGEYSIREYYCEDGVRECSFKVFFHC